MRRPIPFRPYRPSLGDRQYRNTLPHRSKAGKSVFVTWRLADSLPADVNLGATLLRAQRRWLQQRGFSMFPEYQDVEALLQERCPELLPTYRMIPFWVWEEWDQKGCGSCVLASPAAVDAVLRAILEEESWGLRVGDVVLCSNHVHLLAVFGEDADLKGHMQRIKGRASRYLRLAEIPNLPQPIWQRHWFDHLVRSWAKLERIRAYMADHPLSCPQALYQSEWVRE